ncbi:Crp/Fnr family transcriptional regulator [Salinicoccus luteus]|uniref:Crp/Fnr family transcriptional regulator n=1 Tax=Salinicoccus luteus TaxID=367840 RepID=UPI00068FFA5D|nr:Crp/Fnr family transcriptional regulator [Salinicoccus luteus]
MQRSNLGQLLAQIEIFRSLTDDELGLIVDISNQRKFYRSTHIFMQNEPMDHVYFVASGKVKIYRNDASGREQIVNFFQSGEMFPHHGLFREDSYPANAITAETSELITIPKEGFEQLLMDHPEVSIKMFRTLGQLIVDLQKRLEDKIFRSTDKQILLLLERLLTNHGEVIDETYSRISTRLTKQDIANIIGTSRETVSRNITHFKKMNIIDEDTDGFLVVHIPNLNKHLKAST